MSIKQYYSWAQVQEMCASIAMHMFRDNWRPDYIVGLTRGGAVPAVILSHLIGVRMHPLAVSLRDGGLCVSDLSMAQDAYRGMKILIVDDINDTGDTLNWIMEDWASGCFPNDPRWSEIWGHSVRFAMIVDNLSSQCAVSMNYCGTEVNKAEKDVWLVYPWEI